ncbi:MAG: cyclopropane fatty acyl phospholipid synthase [Desulfovibrionaceae bacterium]|nr:cyclopropane fatty acyl phospholipid synthase [Desulfovibrionaceae bacterium]
MDTSKQFVANLLAEADVRVDGSDPWDLRVRDERLFREVLLRKNLGLGEGYMLGWWDCERVDEFICRVLKSGAADGVRGCWRLMVRILPSLLINLQSLSRATIVAKRHYDLGNDLFQAFLDPYLQYSCAYFKDFPDRPGPLEQNDDAVSADLERAQRAKMRLICDKLDLKPGETLLDIGCGWGGLARFAAEEYGCSVVGVNISQRQIEFAREFCQRLPVEILDLDYRLLQGTYDKIVSVGMFEHVGQKNYRTFMETAARCLKPDGLFLLHTIGSNVTSPEIDPWISKYIFPNGILPSIAQIAHASERWFAVEDLHNLGPNYDRTLMCWLRKFRRAWPELREKYGDRFGRMWEYYLQSCAGCFRARDIQLWQVMFTRIGRSQPECRLA